MNLDPVELRDELARRSGRRIDLFLTDNRRRMASMRRRGDGTLEVRLQRIFLRAPDPVLAELAAMLKGGEADRGLLREFVEECFAGDGPAIAARERNAAPSAREKSAHHDIAAYARRLNETYLAGRSTAKVAWGRRDKRRSRRSIRFACYDGERNLVIMNRKLDNPDIPAYFVEYVLFHEMLHEVLGIGERADGKRDIHGDLFKLMESTFPDYEKARRYEKELCRNLGKL